MNKFDEHIQNLLALCSRIGKIQLENQSSLKIKTKSDKSPVTNIDLLSNDIIVEYLLSNFPGDIVISEESIDKTERDHSYCCLLYTSPSPRDQLTSRMPSSA